MFFRILLIRFELSCTSSFSRKLFIASFYSSENNERMFALICHQRPYRDHLRFIEAGALISLAAIVQICFRTFEQNRPRTFDHVSEIWIIRSRFEEDRVSIAMKPVGSVGLGIQTRSDRDQLRNQQLPYCDKLIEILVDVQWPSANTFPTDEKLPAKSNLDGNARFSIGHGNHTCHTGFTHCLTTGWT
jgi:hypothetical protein